MKKMNGKGAGSKDKSKLVWGFTLIEMMITIAIIAILSTIVIVSFQSSKDKANIALVKNSLLQIKARAEAVYSKKGCYTNTTCTMNGPVEFEGNDNLNCPISGDSIFADAKIQALLAETSNARTLYSCKANSLGTSWAIAMSHKSDSLKGLCVSSSGSLKEFTLDSSDISSLNGKMTPDTNGAIICN